MGEDSTIVDALDSKGSPRLPPAGLSGRTAASKSNRRRVGDGAAFVPPARSGALVRSAGAEVSGSYRRSGSRIGGDPDGPPFGLELVKLVCRKQRRHSQPQAGQHHTVQGIPNHEPPSCVVQVLLLLLLHLHLLLLPQSEHLDAS